jgi:hypothetical protein
MDKSRHLYQSNLYGGLGLPPELHAQLPLLLRYRHVFFDIPMSLAAATALTLNHPLLGLAIFVVCVTISIASFWAAKHLLTRRGKWQSGTWYAEVLPGIYKARGILVLLLVISGCGSYLVLAAHIVTPWLTVPTVAVLFLIVPAIIYVSIKQGSVGSAVGNIDHRTDSPKRFWLGLTFYSTLFGLIVAFVIYMLLRVTYGP